MRKSTDFKTRITASNYILGKVFLILLTILVVSLLYRDSYTSLNVFSVLSVVLLVSAIVYKSVSHRSGSRTEKLSLADSIEFPLLLTLLFEVALDVFGAEIFPASYVMLPVLIAYFGWPGSLASVFMIAVIQITNSPGPDLPYQIAFLALSTAVPGYLLRGGRSKLRSYIFEKDIGRQITLPGAISGNNSKDIENETNNVRRLKEDIRNSMLLLRQLVPNHSVILYLKMDDGLFSLSDYISDSNEIIDRGQKLNFRGGYLGWVLKTRTQVLITSVKNIKKNLVYYNKNVPINSLLATPLFLKDNKKHIEGENDIFGMLVVDSLDKNAFGEKEKLIVTLISDRLAEIVDKFQLSEKVKLSSQELNSFYEFTQKLNASRDIDVILDHVLETLERIYDADLLAITLTEGQGESSVMKRVGGRVQEHVLDREVDHRDTLIGLVAESGKYFSSDDLSSRAIHKSVFGKEMDFAAGIKKIKSVLIFPLSLSNGESDAGQENVTGSVIIGRNKKEPFNEGERSLARIICQEACKSIRSSRDFTEVRELAIKDGLTGLYNHRHFQEMLDYTIIHSDRFSGVASVLLIDLDDLKKINDTYGHQAGDSALSTVGRVISGCTRRVDVSARYGGDEFAIILPSTGKAGALRVAEKITDNLRRVPLKLKGATLDITISVGAVTYPNDASDKDSLIEKADRALYASKEEGKNKVTHFEDLSVEELGS